jgi:hypothetical protein
MGLQSFSGIMIIFYCLKFETPATWRARSPYLYPPGILRTSYTSRQWVPFSSPRAIRRAMVEVFEPASTRGHCAGEAQQQFKCQSSITAWVLVAAGKCLMSRCLASLENHYSLMVFKTLHRFLVTPPLKWFLGSNEVPLHLKAEGLEIQA